MSRENVEALPLGAEWEAVSHMDADALVALCDPDVRFESRITAVEDATYLEHEGVRRYIANLAEAFEWIEVDRFDVVEDRDRAVFTKPLEVALWRFCPAYREEGAKQVEQKSGSADPARFRMAPGGAVTPIGGKTWRHGRSSW